MLQIKSGAFISIYVLGVVDGRRNNVPTIHALSLNKKYSNLQHNASRLTMATHYQINRPTKITNQHY